MATIEHNNSWTDKELIDKLKAAYVGDFYHSEAGFMWKKTGEPGGVGVWEQVI